ncbi:MAG: hypothetical protein EPO09_00850 [Aquabacterium sp.]|uniref:anti-sigma factor n=1 Tax=Aquabacterium sp. TaxID=1872578 RepID=UPI0011FCA704|nr:anti-sigma factor [Aquabacterium sp.]TAK99633.1 MAG: hypothetical protein EPO09_00850 [Aquabacterium sp.]
MTASTKTYWHQHPDTIDRLASEYALGTMPPRSRRRFEALMQRRPDIQQAVWVWHDTMAGALVAQKPLAVDAAQWPRLQARVFGAAPAKASWWSRLFGPVPSGMLAFGLLMGLALPPLLQTWHEQQAAQDITSQLPESYVGVLATAQGQAGLVVSSLRKGMWMDIKQQQAVPLPPGQVFYLWLIDKAGQAHPVAAVPELGQGHFVSVRLAQPAEVVFRDAVELAVSMEPQGSQPTRPGGAYVYRGLCGKVWQPPAR